MSRQSAVKRGKGTALPADLSRVEIGQEVSEQVDNVPIQVRVLRLIRNTHGYLTVSMHWSLDAGCAVRATTTRGNASPDFRDVLGCDQVSTIISTYGTGELSAEAGLALPVMYVSI